MKLTDTMLIMLTDAAKRDDRIVIPPERLKGAAAAKVIGKFLAAGLVEEVRAAHGMPEWKRDEDRGSLALVLTDEGLKAIGADPAEGRKPGSEVQQADSPPAKKARAHQPKSAAKPAEAKSKKPTRRPADGSGAPAQVGSKTAQLIRLLQKPGGATIETLTGSLGWLPHTTRAALTGLRKRGFTIERSPTKGGSSTYRITGEPPALASGVRAPKARSSR